MTVMELNKILSGMPGQADVLLCIDENQHQCPHSARMYQPINIAAVNYDLASNTVELREAW